MTVDTTKVERSSTWHRKSVDFFVFDVEATLQQASASESSSDQRKSFRFSWPRKFLWNFLWSETLYSAQPNTIKVWTDFAVPSKA